MDVPWLCLCTVQSDSGRKVSILVGDSIGLWGAGGGGGGGGGGWGGWGVGGG
jgi:hypothetical protein